jgi:hypothetical protein
VGNKYFQEGDLVLKWDKANEMKGKHTKFQKLWLGPYQIHEKIGSGTFRLKTLEGDMEELHVNGQILKNILLLITLGDLSLYILGFFIVCIF